MGVPRSVEELGGPKRLGGPNFSGGTSNPGAYPGHSEVFENGDNNGRHIRER